MGFTIGRSFVWATGFAAALACAAMPSAASANSRAPRASTRKGPVVGVETAYGQAFLGIPYAKQPERWRAPEEPGRWQWPLDASAPGPDCAQPASPFGDPSVSEDCLSLNVYRPRRVSRRRPAPVMVWIHGGAYVTGSGRATEPSRLVEQGTVVVTLNYRLGALGFMAHPSLGAESADGASGNYGLMDQQLALQWVRDNIRRFGGDPDNVTIFGESAGGHSVLAHLTSPASAGLFHRAIVQSGTYTLEQPTQAEWEAAGQAVMATAGCPMGELACMRGLPVETVLASQSVIGPLYLTNTGGALLPLPIGAAIGSGQFNQVPVMGGNTASEYTLFIALNNELTGNPVTEDNYFEQIAGLLGVPLADATDIGSFVYPLAAFPSPSEALAAVGTDAAFACTSLAITDLFAQYVPTYAYQFDDLDAPQLSLPPVSFPYGASHTSELQYLLDVEGNFPQPLDPDQETLSDLMVTYWSQFARNADPNAAGAPPWNAYDPATDRLEIQSLAPGATRGVSLGDVAASHLCEFWSSF